MSLVENVRQSTAEALGVDPQELGYITEELLEEFLVTDPVEPDWESDAEIPSDLVAPEGLGPESFNVYYCWNLVHIGSTYYWKWYFNTPPRGSCLNTTGKRVIGGWNYTGYKCSGSGANIYQITWWS